MLPLLYNFLLDLCLNFILKVTHSTDKINTPCYNILMLNICTLHKQALLMCKSEFLLDFAFQHVD